MNIQWNADLLLTQHYEAPIRFYLHGQRIDLANIKTHIHNRINGIDSEGKHHLLHQEDILFVCPVKKISDVKPYITVLSPVKNLKLKQKSDSPIPSCIDDEKLQTIVGSDTALVTRGGQVIRGELAAFDNYYLFMRIQNEIVLVYRSGLIGFREDVVSSLKQNNPLDELRKKREKWVEANRENGFEDGIKNLLTDLYPDNAHFIYELLQNAEDAGASKVQFFLDEDKVTFEHNGDRLFSLTDVEAITSIGFSTKKDDHTSIGKFGIGFKAVFAYSATPEIESGEFHFRIRDMVVPDTSNLFPASLGEGKTRFIFPFDNPKKSSENARAEIEKNLRQLNENTLLFLSNIHKIEYHLSDSTKGFLELRENTNDNDQIEISVMRHGNPIPDSIHFLRFEKVVSVKDEENDEIKKCKIAVAFGMDKPKNQNWKIKPLEGQVNIYFPAVRETSKLRFHMHAPFASTVARDSVRDCPANDELRDHLAVLVAESMHSIRDRKRLDVEFLATLPNDRDYLSPRYLPIQKQLIKEFNQKKLVPMKQGGHATASESYRTARGERMLSDLITDEDLARLLKKDSSSPLWIANPPRLDSSREDNFLTMLDISEWTIVDLIEILETESDQVMEWLKQKDLEWHQKLYAFLDESTSYYEPELSELCIVRCIDGKYRIGNECHFFGDDVESNEDSHNDSTEVDDVNQSESQKEEIQEVNFYYVDPAVYSSGNNKNQKEKSNNFLKTIGVGEVNETERIKVILKQRYKHPFKPRDEDMKKFIGLVKENPTSESIFNNYSIFEINLKQDNKRWFQKPNKIFVDSPYLDTGLTEYYDAISKNSDYFKQALSPNYAKPGSNIDPEDLGKFAEAMGAQTKLEVIKRLIPDNDPNLSYLIDQAEGQWRHNTGNSEDYFIPELKVLYVKPSIDKSKLIWRTMFFLPETCLKAWYWNNNIDKQRGRPPGKSSLVHELKKEKWVPQKDGDTTIFVRPCDASRDQLPTESFSWPKGHPHDAGEGWLKAIEFGKKAKEQQNEYDQRDQQARKEGYSSLEEKEKSVELAQLLRQKGKLIDDIIFQYSSQNSEANPDFPTSPVKNPEHRGKRVLEQIRNAPQKEYEERIQNVRSTKEEINQRISLKEWYTNNDSDAKEMVCQICKKEMPFKKTDGEYYFIALEAFTIRFMEDEFPKHHFPQEHEAQYLALCPECAARYDYFVRSVKEGENVMEELRNHILNSEDMEFPLILGELETSIRFVEAHLHDLKEVLHYYENPDEVEDSTE